MIIDEDLHHSVINGLGIIKNHTELLLRGTGKHAAEEGRKESLSIILKKADKLIEMLKAVNTG